jgi:hypothetical protein
MRYCRRRCAGRSLIGRVFPGTISFESLLIMGEREDTYGICLLPAVVNQGIGKCPTHKTFMSLRGCSFRSNPPTFTGDSSHSVPPARPIHFVPGIPSRTRRGHVLREDPARTPGPCLRYAPTSLRGPSAATPFASLGCTPSPNAIVNGEVPTDSITCKGSVPALIPGIWGGKRMSDPARTPGTCL